MVGMKEFEPEATLSRRKLVFLPRYCFTRSFIITPCLLTGLKSRIIRVLPCPYGLLQVYERLPSLPNSGNDISFKCISLRTSARKASTSGTLATTAQLVVNPFAPDISSRRKINGPVLRLPTHDLLRVIVFCA